MIRVVLFDLDGVVRHFEPDHATRIERAYGLPAGALKDAAFDRPLLEAVTTGLIGRAEWTRQIGEQIGNADAAQEWSVYRPVVDEAMLALSDEIRGLGLRTAVLTNGTDTIASEIEAHGISDRFDAIFNSADIGFAKPDVRAFQHVLDALMVTGPEVFFTDDSPSNLTGATTLSMRVHLFHSAAELRHELTAAGPTMTSSPPYASHHSASSTSSCGWMDGGGTIIT